MMRSESATKKIKEIFPESVQPISISKGVASIIIKKDKLLRVVDYLKKDHDLYFDYLSDLTGVDYLGKEPRFEVVYHLRSTKDESILRLKVPVTSIDPAIQSITSIYPSADWYEREIYDMFGITSIGHPDMRRILMPEGWKGHPLRKDYPLDGEDVAFTFNRDFIEEQVSPFIIEGKKDGYLELTPDGLTMSTLERLGLSGTGGKMILNMGPQHPSTHGLLRLLVELDGERISKTIPEIGYLHTGIEKSGEYLTYPQALTLTDRADYLANLFNNLAYCMAVEEILGLEIPLRAQYVRVLLCELNRLASHLLAIGVMANELGAISVLLYCFREREMIMDIFEMLSGVRMMTSYITIGGLRDELPDGLLDKINEVLKVFPEKIGEYEKMLSKNPIWLKRTKGIGYISGEDALSFGASGPVLRGSGIGRDLRKSSPYSSYDHFDFDVPVGEKGDVFDRYIIRIEEMRQSLRIIKQVIDRLPDGPVKADNRKILLPPREELGKSMEALIHHFLIASHGFPVPKGEAYAAVEGPRGELGYYVVGDGSERPYRFRIRGPSFANLMTLPLMAKECYIADLVAIVGSIDPVLGDVDR